jgi:hypothetical protein
VDAGDGNNTDSNLNFLPHMDAARLVEGYHSVLKRLYSCEAYYERVKLYLNRIQQQPAERTAGKRPKRQPWVTRDNLRALLTSILRQGVFGRQRWSYWKFLATAATRYHRCFGAAMTLAVMGYHFQVMTRKLSKALESQTLPATMQKALAEKAGGE